MWKYCIYYNGFSNKNGDVYQGRDGKRGLGMDIQWVSGWVCVWLCVCLGPGAGFHLFGMTGSVFVQPGCHRWPSSGQTQNRRGERDGESVYFAFSASCLLLDLHWCLLYSPVSLLILQRYYQITTEVLPRQSYDWVIFCYIWRYLTECGNASH